MFLYMLCICFVYALYMLCIVWGYGKYMVDVRWVTHTGNVERSHDEQDCRYRQKMYLYNVFFNKSLADKILKEGTRMGALFSVKSTMTYLYSAMMPGTLSGVRRP